MDIKIDGVTFSYKGAEDSPVLRGITVDLGGSQVVSILGPNGVGKSTLIHCINKILEPVEGTVFLDGLDVSEYSLKEMARQVGYVPYSSSDSFPLTVVDTVLLGRHPHSGWKTTDEDLEAVYDVLEKLDIQDLAMRYFNELSAGQHQKVMLARGLVQKPKVLLLDEPTSNLDIKHQLGISRTLRQLSHSEGIMVIMISHDLNIAARYSDNVILMHEGRIHSAGTPGEVLTVENILEVYGVKSRIIDDNGRPYIILEDEECAECEPLHGEAVCSTGLGQDGA
ncbi:MAG: ABC transporter ATP-binding protein [Thermoplasmata archaeon]|nr:ABC transporter ATP-binding protein [Thermoplasmata archaeon]